MHENERKAVISGLKWKNDETPVGWKFHPNIYETHVFYRGIRIWVSIHGASPCLVEVTSVNVDKNSLPRNLAMSAAFEIDSLISKCERGFDNSVYNGKNIREKVGLQLESDFDRIDWLLDSKEKAFRERADKLFALYSSAQKELRKASKRTGDGSG